ncbi:hypothetical protein D3C79_828730 [compost metagenome]
MILSRQPGGDHAQLLRLAGEGRFLARRQPDAELQPAACLLWGGIMPKLFLHLLQQVVTAAAVQLAHVADVGGKMPLMDEFGGDRLHQLGAVAVVNRTCGGKSFHQRGRHHQIGQAQRGEKRFGKGP